MQHVYSPIKSAEDFRTRIKLGETPESVSLDFKREPSQLENGKRDRREMARDVAQFANAWGGSLVFGVIEHRKNGRTIAGEVCGVPNAEELRRWVAQDIGLLLPSTLSVDPVAIDFDGKTVVVVNVPPTLRTVAVWDRGSARAIEYVRRVDQDKTYLNPDEVIEVISQERSRASMLAVARAVQSCCVPSGAPIAVELASGVWSLGSALNGRVPGWAPHSAASVTLEIPRDANGVPTLTDFELPLTIHTNGRSIVHVPYGLIREAWVTVDGRLGLLLDVRIVFNVSGFILGPPI